MKKVRFSVILLAIATMVGLNAEAQFQQSIFLNGTIPFSDFGSDTKNKNAVPLTSTDIAKDVTLGFGIGYRASYRFDIGYGMVAPYVGVDFLYNMANGEQKDNYFGANDMDVPNYFNIPLFIGVQYLYTDLWRDIKPYGEFGVGTDLFIITHEGVDTKAQKYNYKTTSSLSWTLGAGTYLGEHFSVGLNYYGLGKHTIEYTKSTIKHNSAAKLQQEVEGKQKRGVGMLALRLGFHF